MDISQALYIESVDRKCFVYTSDQVYETDSRLYELERDLGRCGFFRVSKSCLVNLHNVRSLRADIDRRIRISMSNGEQIIASRSVFFTDLFLKKMPLLWRMVCLVTVVIALTGAFIVAFRWFPVSSLTAWTMFFVCFAISFSVSCLVISLKEKSENKRLDEALKKLKEMEQ